MAEEKKELTAEIIIQYEPGTGRFGLGARNADQLLILGMLAKALKQFEHDWELAKLMELNKEQDKKILTIQ